MSSLREEDETRKKKDEESSHLALKEHTREDLRVVRIIHIDENVEQASLDDGNLDLVD
jgi:hypothetical protein